jgi:DNA repair protein RadA/Sms
MRKGIFSISDVESKEVERLSSGIDDLDTVYGGGLPRGRVSVWSGAPGVGKSRTTIDISCSISMAGYRVFIFQNEVNPEEFKQWVTGRVDEKNYFICNYNTIEEQVEAIRKYKPDFIVTDSLNMIQGFNSLSKIRDIMLSLKNVVSEVNAHAILIGQLNKEGVTKGSNEIPHLVDIVCSLKHHEACKERIGSSIVEYEALPGVFYIRVDKNRYGKSGGWVAFLHESNGIRQVSSSIRKEIPKIQEKPQQESIVSKMFSSILKYVISKTG